MPGCYILEAENWLKESKRRDVAEIKRLGMNHDDKYYRFGKSMFLFGVLLILFYQLIDNFTVVMEKTGFVIGGFFSLLIPIILGFAFAFLLNPGLNLIERKLSSRFGSGKIRPYLRVLSVIVLYAIVISVFAVTIRYIVPDISRSVVKLVDFASDAYDRHYDDFWKMFEEYRLDEQFDFEKYLDYENYDYASALKYLMTGAAKITTSVFNFVMAFVISIYVLIDKERFSAMGKKAVYLLFPYERYQGIMKVCSETRDIFLRYFVGKTVDSLIVGILCYFGLVIMKNPFPLIIAILVGVTNMIPYFGPIFGSVPAVIISFIDRPISALWVLIFILVLQQFDGLVLGPKILGDSTGLRPFWVLVSILIGGSLFGVLGMLLAVPATAALGNILSIFINGIYERKKESEKLFNEGDNDFEAEEVIE